MKTKLRLQSNFFMFMVPDTFFCICLTDILLCEADWSQIYLCIIKEYRLQKNCLGESRVPRLPSSFCWDENRLYSFNLRCALNFCASELDGLGHSHLLSSHLGMTQRLGHFFSLQQICNQRLHSFCYITFFRSGTCFSISKLISFYYRLTT